MARVAVGVSAIAFGGMSWALDGASAPVAAVLRLEAAMAVQGALAPPQNVPRPAAGLPVREIRFRDITFSYPGSDRPVIEGFDLTLQAGTSLAIVGQNGAGKTTLAKLLCRLYDPQGGGIEVDGVDLRDLDVDAWRARLAAVFQDFIRFELAKTVSEPVRRPSPRVRPAVIILSVMTLRISEAELVRDVRSVLEKVRTGSEVVIENADHSPVAVMRKPKVVGRDIDECIRIAKAREAQEGDAAPDPDFAADVAAAVAAHREPLETPGWD